MWEHVELRHLGSGSRPALKAGPFGSSITKSSYVLEGFKLYGQQEVIAGVCDATGYFVTVAEYERLASCQACPGDILVTMMGSVGESFVLPPEAPAGIINPRLIRLSLDHDRVDPHFVQAVLSAPETRSLLSRRAHGGTMEGLNSSTLGKLRIPLPPLVEQRKIAEILRTWDDAIDAAERTREFMIRRRKAVVDRLVFPSGKPSGLKLGGLPEGWEAQPIGTLAREVSERNSLRETEVILSCSKRLGFVLNEDYFGRRTHSADVSGYKLIRFGQFGFPSNHVEEGSIGLQNLVELAAVSPIYTVFEFGPRVDPGFAFLVFKTEAYRHMFEVSTSASVSRRGSLRWNEFSRLSFPVPSIARQGEIVRAVAAVDTELALLDRKIELLKRQKRGLMQKLLSGEIRVKTDDVHSDEGVGA